MPSAGWLGAELAFVAAPEVAPVHPGIEHLPHQELLVRARSEGQVARHAIKRRVLEVTVGVERPVGPAALDLLGQQVLGRAPVAIAGLPEAEQVEVVFVGGGIQRRQLDELLAAREARDHELLVGHGPALVTDVLVDQNAGIEPGRESRRQPERMYRRRGEALDRAGRAAGRDRDRRSRGSPASASRTAWSRPDRAAPRPQTRAVCDGPVPTRDSQTSSGVCRPDCLLRSQLAAPTAPTHTTKPSSARQPLIREQHIANAARGAPRAPRRSRPRLLQLVSCVACYLTTGSSRARRRISFAALMSGFRSDMRVTPGPPHTCW